MKLARALLLAAGVLAEGCARTTTPAPEPAKAPAADLAALEAEVRNTENAFARTMAQRDFTAFQGFVSADAVFLSGKDVLRGRPAVAAAWQAYFDGTVAPFAWQPDSVSVLASGDLALSAGPVTGPNDASFGRFSSVWRRESDGRWRIVFDKGEAPCPCRATP